MAQVDAQLRAGGGYPLPVEIIAVGCQEPYIQTHQTHVVGDIPAHAAQRHTDPAGIGVRRDQRGEGPAADIHVDAAYHHHIAAAAQDVALSGDVALFHQVGDVDGGGGPGDAQPVRDSLLGDHGVGFNELQNLPLPLCHGAPSFAKHKLII